MDTKNRDEMIEEMIEAHKGVVAAISRRAGYQTADVEDLIQKVYLQARVSKTIPQNPKAWLSKIARNLLCNCTTRRSIQERAYTRWEEVRVHWAGERIDDPLTTLEKSELAEAVRVALCKLPSDQQTVVRWWLKGRTHAEIAIKTSLSERTVQRKWEKACKQLRKELEPFW